MKIIIAASLALVLSVSALRAADQGHDVSDEEHRHEHTAPHGGTLVVLGEEFAHLELVLDPGAGSLTGYILDGEAENAVRIGQEGIEIKINDSLPPGGGSDRSGYVLTLKAVSNVLTGETAGDTSEFAAQSDKLKGVQKFDAVISVINVKGQTFRNTGFRFPEGNE
jgi:hypothetical protein